MTGSGSRGASGASSDPAPAAGVQTAEQRGARAARTERGTPGPAPRSGTLGVQAAGLGSLPGAPTGRATEAGDDDHGLEALAPLAPPGAARLPAAVGWAVLGLFALSAVLIAVLTVRFLRGTWNP